MAVARGTFSGGSSSRTTSPLPHHRFDHMIGEQKTLVLNAQGGLNQSLLILEKAVTKEERETAALQVESLLLRCEELLTKLRVVVHIRCELGCLQEHLKRSKKSGFNPQKLYTRQQWLENRLEKLVLSKRRPRPRAKGLRAPSTQDGFLRQHQSQVRKVSQPMQTNFKKESYIHSHKRSATISTMSDVFGAPSYSQRSDEASSNMSLESEKRTTVTQSVVDRGSSEWNSESEAGWTVMDASSDVVAKQFLKEQQQEGLFENVEEGFKMEEKRASTVNSGEEGSRRTHSEIVSNVGLPSFESPRPVSVFGANSWNALCFAKFGNFVDENNTEGPSDEFLNSPLIDDRLLQLWSEVKKLQELVQEAGKFMKMEGQTLPQLPSRRSLSSSLNRKERRASGRLPRFSTAITTPAHSLLLHLVITAKLKSHVSIPDVHKNEAKLSRRILMKSGGVYPKPTSTWLHSSEENKSRLMLRTIHGKREEDFEKSMPCSSRSSRRLRTKSAINRDELSLVEDHLTDYRKSHIQDLLDALSRSECIERRKDAAEELSSLHNQERQEDVIKTLKSAVANDNSPVVRYEAIRSLMKCGAWDLELYLLVTKLLEKGNADLKLDILTVLVNEKCLVNDQASNGNNEDGKQQLILALEKLINDELLRGSEVSFKAALVLSEAHAISSCSEEVLRRLMRGGSPQQKAKAVECIVMCVGCMDSEVIGIVLELAEKSVDWKVRLTSVKCLLRILQELQDESDAQDTLLKFVKKRLPLEPIQAVRIALGELAKQLNVKDKLELEMIRKLEKQDEMERAKAAIALSSFASGNSKVQNALMDLVEFDPSTYIKLLAISLIGNTSSPSSLMVSRLLAKCNGTGTIASHCRSAYMNLSNR